MSLKDQLKDTYLNWLRDSLKWKDVNGVIEITCPLVDRHNDFLQIYVIPQGDTLRLTDDAYIISDLMLSGCDIRSTPKRREILKTILNSSGVTLSQNDELCLETTIEKFPQRKHMLLQAMVAVNDMFMVTRSTVQKLFIEDVEEFFEEHDIRVTDNVNFTGKTGFTHRFDFVIPKSKEMPERVIHTINNLTRNSSENLLWSWNDTRDTRKPGSRLYAFIDDTERKPNKEALSALTQYEVQPIVWSEREKFLPELTS